MRYASRLIKGIYLIAALLLLLLIPACKSGSAGSACKTEDKLALESTCFAATVLTQGSPFQINSTVSLKMKIGAVNSQFQPIPATISTKAFNSLGQLVAQQTQQAIQPNSNYQNVPIWTNVNVASGSYTLEVGVSVGACGSKTMCLTTQIVR
jgi:hypothetical protein